MNDSVVHGKPGNVGDDAIARQGEHRLLQLLARVRRRLWFLDSAQGTCWGLLGALATLLIGMWFDLVWELPSTIRAASWGCAVVVLVLTLGLLLARTWQRMEARRMSRRIDAASGFHGELLNGFEFAAGRVKGRQGREDGQEWPSSITEGLAQLAIARAGELAQQVPPAVVVSPRPALLAARSLAISAAVIALLVFVCPTLAKTQWQRFAHPFDDTPPYSPYKITVDPGDVDVVYGKGLEVRVTVEGPLVHDCHLVLTAAGHDEKVPMFPEANGSWRAQLSRLTENATYIARVDRARSLTYRIRVITTPSIDEVLFRVTPPAYTNEPVTSGPLPKAGLTGLKGTRVQVTARSNRPLSSGEVRIRTEAQTDTVALRPAQKGDSVVVGEFTITRTAKFDLNINDTDGQVSQEPFVGSVTLIVDQRPLVRILEPKAQSLATPTSTLPIVIDAEDDYGLSRIELYRSLNDSRPLATSLALPEPPPRRFRDYHGLPLAHYDLQPGDEIKLFARVTDNDPDSPKGAESTIVMIRIIAQEDFERMLRTREGLEVLMSKYQQAERRLESLADEIAKIQNEMESADPDSPASEELQERLEKLAKEMHDEANAIAEAAEHDLPYDIDENLKKKLEELAEQLRSEGDELEKLAERSKDKNDVNNDAIMRQLAKIKKRVAEEKDELDQEATEPLELLAKVYPLIEDQARYTALTLWQKDLAERLAAFKDIERSEEPAAKARLRDLQDEQRRVRDELVKLLEDIDNHVKALPEVDQFDELRDTATEFLAAVRASGAEEEMTDAETSLTDFLGGEAYVHALEAAAILEKFLSKSEGMGQGGAGGQTLRFNPTLSEMIGDSINQLLEEAGLGGMGSGKGKGSGRGRGGYSMRSGNRNVGLYGGIDSFGGKANSGGGFGKSGKPASGKNAWNDPSRDPTSITAPFQRSSSSANTLPVPPQYRRRVNQYFQRVADELEAAGK